MSGYELIDLVISACDDDTKRIWKGVEKRTRYVYNEPNAGRKNSLELIQFIRKISQPIGSMINIVITNHAIIRLHDYDNGIYIAIAHELTPDVLSKWPTTMRPKYTEFKMFACKCDITENRNTLKLSELIKNKDNIKFLSDLFFNKTEKATKYI